MRGKGKENATLKSKPQLRNLNSQRSYLQVRGKDALLFREREAAGGKHAREQLETKAEGDGAEEEETFSMGFPMRLMH